MKSNYFLARLTCAGVAVIGHCHAVIAAPTLDQSYVPPGLTSVSGDTFQSAQTFTSSLTGLLARVDVNIALARGTDAVFEIRPTSGGIPVADDLQILATLPVPQILTVPAGLITFDLTSFSIPVTPGQVLAFNIRAGPSDALITFRLGDELLSMNPDYLGGAYLRRARTATTQPFEDPGFRADIKFQTFVQVPEPASLLLLALCVIAALGSRTSSTSQRRRV